MQGPHGDAGHWEGWREQAPHLSAGLLPIRGWQHRGQVGPFPSCPNTPREVGLAMRTGSHTGWHLLSHWEEDGGHRRENSHEEFWGVLCGLPERPGRVTEAESGPELRANSWSKAEMREETQPLPRILLPLPPRAPARAALKPPAVPAPGSRSIVGMGLVGSKRRAPRSGLVLQCLCSIPAMTSHSPKTSLSHALLASEAWAGLLSCVKRKGRNVDGE